MTTDVVDKLTRSRMMSNIKAKNTKPEIVIRRALHGLGFRYKLHDKKLPGTPDLVFPKYKAIIQIHGCFWHHHDCHLFKWPKNRAEFWADKIKANRARDARNVAACIELGWKVLVIWECAMKGRTHLDHRELINEVACWVQSAKCSAELGGRTTPPPCA